MARTRQTPKCHPDRKHCARGLCRNCYYREYMGRLRESEDGRALLRRVYRRCSLRRKFGITQERYDAMAVQYNNRCCICGEKQIGDKSLAVDHCHATDVIRGLLCSHCNRGIGLFRDSPLLLRLAAEYLERSKQTKGAA